MEPLTNAIAGLLGALIGAGAAIIATVLNAKHLYGLQQDRWEREDHSRFHADRRHLYARYLTLAEELGSEARRFDLTQRDLAEWDDSYTPQDAEAARKRYRSLAESRFSALLAVQQEISLLATSEVVSAAEQIAHIGLVWSSPSNPASAEDTRPYDIFNREAKPRFLAAARRELGVD